MQTTTLAFIGGGNMAASIIGGLLRQGWPAQALQVAEPNEQRRHWLQAELGIEPLEDNTRACQRADVVLMAVKPQVMTRVTAELAPLFQQRQPLLISIAAGVPSGFFTRRLHPGLPVVRAMPNTPALVGEGACVLFANPKVSPQQRSLAERILEATGLVRWVDDEQHMHAVTALSGSGPAYFFRMMEALEAAATARGLPADLARELVIQTALGAARLARVDTAGPAELRQRVTSPGGTTEAALNRLEQGGLAELMQQAVDAAWERSHTLETELEDQP